MVEWLTLILRFQQVPTSNLYQELGILTEVFRDFPSFSKQLSGYYFRLNHDRFLTHSFQFIIDLSSFHSTLRTLIY